jgi:hypothetical protein
VALATLQAITKPMFSLGRLFAALWDKNKK